MVPLSFGCGSAVLAAIATLAPSRAARNAIASPMPRLPPDTNSVLPLSDVIMLPCGVSRGFLPLDLLSRRVGATGTRIGRTEQSIWRHGDRVGRSLPHRLDTPGGLCSGARPAYRRQNRVRSSPRPAAIDGAGGAPPPRPRHPCDSRVH